MSVAALRPLPRGVVPAGTLDLAHRHAAALAHAVGLGADSIDGDALAIALVAPLVLAAANDRSPPLGPPPPRLWGDGALCVDLGPDDVDTIEQFFALADLTSSTAVVAAAAQEWRLGVTAYRRHNPARRPCEDAPPPVAPAVALFGGSLSGTTVIDHTVMWAGPLATALLAERGATVVKVEPACRPDGLRHDPPLFASLNGTKAVVSLDLRRDAERAEYLELVREADLVVDNFSPRVAPNLGIPLDVLREVNPTVARCALPAFPAGSPQADWVAYGPAVHAHQGLGDAGAAGIVAPVVSYPDPLAGLRAAAAMANLLATRRAGSPPGDTAVLSLAGAIAPLVSCHVPGEIHLPEPVALAEWIRHAVLCCPRVGEWNVSPSLFFCSESTSIRCEGAPQNSFRPELS